MKNRPLVVFVFTREGTGTSTRYGGFAKRLQKRGGLKDCDVLTCALENLVYLVREDKTADVIDSVSNTSLGKASFVYIKSWESMPEEGCALALFLQGRGISFIDALPVGVGVSKLSTAMRLWANEIAVPDTLYIRRHDRLVEYLKSSDWAKDKKIIIKDINGAKGKVNYLASTEEIPGILSKHPDTFFVCQRYIPNSGDYRVGIYANKPGFIIKRVGSGKSHLNNTSVGGKAEYLLTNELPKKLVKIAKEAAAASELTIAGVDIIVDSQTDKPYVLEVNQGSQIVTGAYVEENIRAFNKAIDSLIVSRHAKSRQKPIKTIGRRTTVALPDLGVYGAVAKIDTGAYSSTMHAENIHIENEKLVFDIVPADGFKTRDGKSHTISTSDYFVQKVRSSNGQIAERYSIRTRLAIGGKIVKAVLTLSDRTEMGYPLLIGRKVVRSRFVVNVELEENNRQEWKY